MTDLAVVIKNLGDVTGCTLVVTFPEGTSTEAMRHISRRLERELPEATHRLLTKGDTDIEIKPGCEDSESEDIADEP